VTPGAPAAPITPAAPAIPVTPAAPSTPATPGAPAIPGLPATGANVFTLIVLGLGLVALGVLTVTFVPKLRKPRVR
jgi:hypothetical protein